MILNIFIVIVTFLAMEFVAWFTHKYVMHGFLWTLHASHHKPRKGIFERNDLFFVYFAAISAYFYITGIPAMDYRLYIGIGVSLYGLAYFIVHDIFIHRRINLFGKTEHPYLKALRQAHYEHHKHHGKYGAESFGMLIIAPKYYYKAKRKRAL